MLLGCSKDDSTVNIRLSNVSNYSFENIIVGSPSNGEVFYDNLKSGQISNYKPFDEAYGYAFIELEIDGNSSQLSQ